MKARQQRRLLSRTQSASYLGVSLHIFDAMERAGDVRPVYLPQLSHKRFDVQELDRLIEAGKTSMPATMPKTMPRNARNYAEFMEILKGD